MAKDFALVYRDVPWTGIYSSPLKRTLSTATPLSDLLAIPIHKREGLKEIAYGQWEGKTAAEVNREFHRHRYRSPQFGSIRGNRP